LKIKKWKIILALGIISAVFFFTAQFIQGFYFLNDDEKVMAELASYPDLLDYEVLTLGKVYPKYFLEASSSWDLSHNRVRNFSYYVRVFHAWKHSKGSVSPDENMVITGFIDMRKRVFIRRIETEYMYNLPKA
jgi:hypothetical protein